MKRHKAERALRLELSRRHKAVLDALPDAYVVLGAEGDLEGINARALRLLGVDGDPAKHPALKHSGGLDLGPVRVEVSRAPLPGGATLVRLQDVTELRRLESVRQDFVANVSHELRTPVSVIQANAEALLDGGLDEPELAEAFLDAIGRNTERLGELITDLLALAELESGEGFDLTVLDASHIADKVCEDVDVQQLVRRGTEVVGDGGALEQVLTNYVSNALKYGGEGVKVELRAKKTGRSLRLEVHDSGPGVPEKYRDRVFERFFRVDKGRSRRMGGTGLGLSIVRHLAAAMDASVGVRDSDLGGACFYIKLRRPS